MFSKCITLLIVTFTFCRFSYSQSEFKEVKTGQDVIDNYILAIGGKSKLKKIKSETVKGTFDVHEFKGSFLAYRNDTIYFTKAEGTMEGKEMLLMKSVLTNNYSWQYQMGEMMDYTGDDLKRKAEDLITGSLGFYLNYNTIGYNAELKGVDSVNGKECYKVLFSKSGKDLRTNFYDKKTFYVLRSEKPEGLALEFEDFRKVDGITRPFKILQFTETQIDEIITEYKFNQPVDVTLLAKPDNK